MPVVSTAPTPIRIFAGEIPLEAEGGTFVVPALINNQIALKFTLDSGAADVSLPADVVSTLVRTGTITQADFIGSRTFELADGSTVPSAEFRIRSLKVGRLTLHDVTASIADSRASLLLGQSFLSRLSSWSIDNRRHVLIATAAEGEAGKQLQLAQGEDSSSSEREPTEEAALEPSGSGALTPSPTGASAAAVATMQGYLEAWSKASDPDGQAIRPFYAPTISYYGKQKSVDQVMIEKSAFARRWPSRTYEFVPGSILPECVNQTLCDVQGVVKWSARSADGTRVADGTAMIKVRLQGGLISSETSKVLTRG